MSWLEEYILICCGEERMIEMRRAKERKGVHVQYGGRVVVILILICRWRLYFETVKSRQCKMNSAVYGTAFELSSVEVVVFIYNTFLFYKKTNFYTMKLFFNFLRPILQTGYGSFAVVLLDHAPRKRSPRTHMGLQNQTSQITKVPFTRHLPTIQQNSI